ncbi:DUF2306 domain-containing protein [Pseudoalteromonas aurantia]|uniref:DUF2306 domain-containing protein n=1 Tax=Pseudoalteromonas aurantia 208 TaxID=1314867 RepID=A0ABR9EFC6_9GAMM|nr:hypothetical protein [Pseudoalteromonas aurantia]MBE0368960.1 hypothetical protein [Pseudoalteromonas aurantia 208]
MFLSVMTLHILSGAMALLAGYAVILFPKGESSHKYLGRAYVGAILTLGITGTYIAILRDVPISIMNGLVLCYFVLSALNTVWQPVNRINVFDKALFVFALLLTVGFIWYSYQTTQVDDGKLGGFGIEAYLAFGSVVAFCTVADYHYIKLGGLRGRRKLVRHLWRMFFPLFMSTAAFFLGQARHLPEALQSIEFILLPVVFVILSAVYWVIKVMARKRSQAISWSQFDKE